MNDSNEAVNRWLAANRGIPAAIAKHLKMSRTHVHHVLRQKRFSVGGLIEGLLADLGAPGMRDRQKQAQLRNDPWTRQEIARLLAELKKIQAKRRAA